PAILRGLPGRESAGAAQRREPGHPGRGLELSPVPPPGCRPDPPAAGDAAPVPRLPVRAGTARPRGLTLGAWRDRAPSSTIWSSPSVEFEPFGAEGGELDDVGSSQLRRGEDGRGGQLLPGRLRGRVASVETRLRSGPARARAGPRRLRRRPG